MEKKDYLVIILPESMADVPVRVYCMENQEQFGGYQETDAIPICRRCRQPEYAFIWQYEGYLKVTLDEIQWIEARGSYSEIHLTGEWGWLQESFGGTYQHPPETQLRYYPQGDIGNARLESGNTSRQQC